MRLDGYNNIIIALDQKLAYLHAHMHEMEVHKDMDDEERNKYRIASQEGDEGIERTKRIGRIFLSKEALALVNAIQPRLNKAAKGIEWGDVYGMMDAHAYEYQKIIDDMIARTKIDLGLKES